MPKLLTSGLVGFLDKSNKNLERKSLVQSQVLKECESF